jgi:hypothetical protein
MTLLTISSFTRKSQGERVRGKQGAEKGLTLSWEIDK